MIEKTVYNYLTSKITTPVYIGEKPNTKSNEYVVVKVIEKTTTNHIDAVTLYFESYSTSLLKAAELDEKVREKMTQIIELSSISSCKIGGGGQRIETETKSYCYESIFNIYYTE